MNLFWFFAAILALLAAAFVFWPLRGGKPAGRQPAPARDDLVLDLFNEHKHQLQAQLQAGEIDRVQFDQLSRELELSLLEDTPSDAAANTAGSRAGSQAAVLIVAALLVPLAALVFYWQQGNLQDVEIRELQRDYMMQQMSAPQADSTARSVVLEQLIARLEQRLASEPDNSGNRYLLARSHMQAGDYPAAIRHYSRLLEDGNPPPHVLAELAQAIFLAAGHQITGEVEMLAGRALQMDPNESTALGLMGIGAFQQQRYAAAIDYWQRAVARLGPASPGGQSLVFGIERARALLQESGDETDSSGEETGSGDTESAVAGAARIAVQVQLAESVRASPQDTVFVYARAWQGARMPLAITRLQVSDLPREIVLDESMAMAPGMSLSSAPRLELVARISASGSPTAASGDWQVTRGPISLDELEQPLMLEIQQQIP